MHTRPVPVLASLLVLFSVTPALANPDRPSCACPIHPSEGSTFSGARWEDGVCYELSCIPGDCRKVAGKKVPAGEFAEKDGMLVEKPLLGMSHEGCVEIALKKRSSRR